MTTSREYWKNMPLNTMMYCPHLSFFRFLSNAGVSFSGLNVFEVGFGCNAGADLVEFKRRGGNCKGGDLSEKHVHWFSSMYPDIDVRVMDAGKDPISIRNLDLIYSHDTIYYLSNDQIQFHFQQAYESLSGGGCLSFQVIEKDFKIDKGTQYDILTNFSLFLKQKPCPIYPSKNPVRLLDLDKLVELANSTGFERVASKTVIESYDPEESHFRVNRWFLFRK